MEIVSNSRTYGNSYLLGDLLGGSKTLLRLELGSGVFGAGLAVRAANVRDNLLLGDDSLAKFFGADRGKRIFRED